MFTILRYQINLSVKRELPCNYGNIYIIVILIYVTQIDQRARNKEVKIIDE